MVIELRELRAEVVRLAAYETHELGALRARAQNAETNCALAMKQRDAARAGFAAVVRPDEAPAPKRAGRGEE